MQRILSEIKREFDRDRCHSMNAFRRQSFEKPYDERDIKFLEEALRLSPGLASYAALFSFKGNALSGDITPAYSMLGPKEIEDIRTFFPNLKLVFLARDPIDRALSHLQMYKRQRKHNELDLEDVGSIEAFLRKERMDLRSRPTKTIQRWQEFFPAEQLHVEVFDGLARDAIGVRTRIFQFLGLSPDKGADAIPADYNRKKSRQKYPITPLARDLLIEMYQDEIIGCAELLGGAAKEWPSRYGL